MARSLWSGAIDFGALTMHVEVLSGTQKYDGQDKLRQVCECHHKPLVRTEACAATGAVRQTEALTKAGKTGAKVVKAVERAPDDFVVIDENALKAIDAAVSSNVCEPEALIERSTLPLARIETSYYVKASKKVAGSMGMVAIAYTLLRDQDKALIGKWSYRGRQHRVALIVEDGVLTMLRLRYDQETVTPDAEVMAPAAQTVDPQMVSLFAQALTALPTNWSSSVAEDESISQRSKAVAAALAGEAAPTVEATPEQSAVPDLMAALQAAAANAPGRKATSKPTPKARVKA